MSILRIRDGDGNWQDVPAVKGPKGKDGVTPTISVTVEAVDSNQSASVTQSGTTTNPSIKLKLPRGAGGAVDTSGFVTKTGSQGNVAGYSTPMITGTAMTVTGDSADSIQYNASTGLTIPNGTTGTSWTKVINLTQSIPNGITMGNKWSWLSEDIPTIKANSILVLNWCNDRGLAFVDRSVSTTIAT